VWSPGRLGEPVATYYFGDGWRHSTVLLDRETKTWFMYHRRAGTNDIYVRTARVVGSTSQGPDRLR